MRVIFSGGGTGGHLYPGLAVARALVKRRPDVRPHFVGAERGIERDVLPRCEFPYTLLKVHPLYRRTPWNNWRTVIGAMSGWRGMTALARQERPAIVVGTGSYASALPLAWASAHNVTIVQQIGDAFPGAAARLFARVSQECYLGFADAEKHLPAVRARYLVTGNAIDPPPNPRPDRNAMMQQWRLDAAHNVVLVFGGSQGAQAINDAVAAWTRTSLPDGWSVIWATGKSLYERYRASESPRVRVMPYLSPIADAYAVANLAIVRGGAIGTAELCAWGVPMIVVPLPTAAQDHQTWNARSLERAGAGVCVTQRELNPERLDKEVRAIAGDAARLVSLSEGARKHGRPDAANDIARHIAHLLPL